MKETQHQQLPILFSRQTVHLQRNCLSWLLKKARTVMKRLQNHESQDSPKPRGEAGHPRFYNRT